MTSARPADLSEVSLLAQGSMTPMAEQPLVEQWCSDLVARVEPGGLAARQPKSAPDPAEQPGTTTIGERYRLEERVGSGGMGEVWRAQNVQLGREVAIKLLLRGAAASGVSADRLLREARLASAVRHPGIVDILDVGVAPDGRAFIVMEFLEGTPLSTVLDLEGALPWPRARDLTLQLADALCHAHSKGVVHRDLKPSNVMMIGRDGGAQSTAVLIDFGMARGQLVPGAEATLTATGEIFGTPAYMSPEQFRGAPADERSDVYALGCMLYELLAGQRPFTGTSAAELMYQHLLEPFPTLISAAGPGRVIRGGLRRVLATACHKSPERRFATMAAFAHAVRALDDVPSALGRDRARWLASGAAVLATGAAVLVGAWSGLAPEAGPRRVAAASIVPFSSPSASAALSEASDGVAVPTPAQRTIRSIHASLMFSCVLTGGGEVQCWGKTGSYFGRPEVDGHIGDDELPSHAPPLDFGGRKVVSLAVDYWSTHLCALLDDGAARCWGDNGHGQLGLGPDVGDIGDSAGESPATTPNLPLEDIRAIYTQSGWTCALTGPLGESQAWCWGLNRRGQLGQGHGRDLASPPAVPIDFGGASPLDLDLGLNHGCARLDDGSARCWGSNGKHQLGNGLPITVHIGDGIEEGSARGTALPTSPEFAIGNTHDLKVAQLRANGGWTCLLTNSGDVRCWGGNLHGTLGYRYDQIPGCLPQGLGNACPVSVPTSNVDLGEHGGSRIVDLRQGRQRACVLDDQGAVRCWGHATDGALGYGQALDKAAPAGFIGHLTSPADVYAAMGNDGIIDVGDRDHDGKIDRVLQLAVGYNHACVLMEDQSVRCWGGNGYGQLGYGTLEDVGDDETPAEYYAAHDGGAVSLWPD